mgnify:CR=1 FL=1
MSNDPRGTIIQQGNIMRIDNALVEEVFCYDNSVGHILISMLFAMLIKSPLYRPYV